MTDRAFHISKSLVVALILAASSTGALIIAVITADLPSGRPPGPPPGTNGIMPPPPDLRPLAVITVVTGLFVLAWLAALVIFCRDQILAQTRGMVSQDELAEYGERRETDGYLAGMRSAAAAEAPEANVRALRRTPPQR
jgi:hypothetical protein